MRIIFLLSIFFPMSLLASSESGKYLMCELWKNSELKVSKKVEIPLTDKVIWAKDDSLKLYLDKAQNANVYSLEIYKSNIPSREYAEGKVKDGGDILRYISWTREQLLEARCYR